ncbi:MAG: folate-binding protein [Methylococcaceae bacterium]|nr:folate-binding protein [Methylococcaceae bacterium]
MNIDWIDFLKSNNATFTDNSEILFSEDNPINSNSITAIAHLSIISISGKDASQFLQGQLSCNINKLTDSTSFFTAFSNAKGRTISSLLVLKQAENYILILPEELIEKVINKLRMYILRSEVKIKNITDELAIIGVTTNQDLLPIQPETNFSINNSSEITIKFPSKDNRFLIVSPVSQAKALWTQLTQNNNLTICNSTSWRYQDISAGIPWLTEATSEQYIPQMLNIDKLGGISFNKGCFTGQEIIARTHYLGKAKRALFLAECNSTALLDNDIQIIKDNNEQSTGKVLSLQSNGQTIRLLIVMPTADSELKNLIFNNSNQDKINLIDFQ